MSKGKYLCWSKPGHEQCWVHNIMAPIEAMAAEILAEHGIDNNKQYGTITQNG